MSLMPAEAVQRAGQAGDCALIGSPDSREVYSRVDKVRICLRLSGSWQIGQMRAAFGPHSGRGCSRVQDAICEVRCESCL